MGVMLNENTALENYVHLSEITYETPPGVNAKGFKDGRFIFSAYGCALVERQTDSGVYVYTAVNQSTGKSQILSRRNNALVENGFCSMAAKISKSPVRGSGRFIIDKKPDDSMRGSFLLEAANRIFTEILPKYGYAIRDKQIELTEHILGVTEHRGVTLAESEVGTGKTHAYLIAAMLAKRGRLNDFWLRGHYREQSWAESAHMPVVISTSSIALQEAIVKDYIPELSRIMMQWGVISTPLTAVVRKGKQHYICEERLRRYFEGVDSRTKGLLNPFLGNDAPFDLTGVDSLTPHMKRRICVQDNCGNCQFKNKCRYQRYLKKANDPAVDFQITNHNYFLADRLHRASGRKQLIPHYQLAIIDEAHKFLAAARSMYGLELTDMELPELVQEIHTFTIGKSNKGVNVHRLAKKLEEQSRKLFGRLCDNIPVSEEDDDAERFPAIMDSDISHRLKNISGIMVDLAEAIEDSYVQPTYSKRRDRAIWKLNRISESIHDLRSHSKHVCWLENRVEGEVESQALCAIPKDLDERLFNDLWNNGIPVVLTSGTLSASGDFTRQKHTLGLYRLPDRKLFETTMPSPFDYKNNAMLYFSEATPFPDNKDKRYVTAIADEIERLVIASHGHAAVLFTSYNVMGQVHTILKNRRLSFPLFRLERSGTHAIEQFKKSGNGILLASGALWEGIDIPGDTLSLLIIVKLPFAVPDPIGDYERTLYESMDAYKRRAIIPDMIVKLMQGCGRLIRTETDTGVVAILDSRANLRGAYRHWILSALPSWRVTDNIETVRKLMKIKKLTAYFD